MPDALKKAKIFNAFGETIIIKKEDMFKHLAGLTLAAISVQAQETSDLAKV